MSGRKPPVRPLVDGPARPSLAPGLAEGLAAALRLALGPSGARSSIQVEHLAGPTRARASLSSAASAPTPAAGRPPAAPPVDRHMETAKPLGLIVRESAPIGPAQVAGSSPRGPVSALVGPWRAMQILAPLATCSANELMVRPALEFRLGPSWLPWRRPRAPPEDRWRPRWGRPRIS